MEEVKKETKTLRIEKEVIEHAEKNPLIPSFSEWISDAYKKEFMEIESISKKMQEHIDITNNCKERILKLKKDIKRGSDLKILKPLEMQWMKEQAPGRIKRTTFEGVYKSFVNTFNRKDINRKQFRLFVERLKTEK